MKFLILPAILFSAWAEAGQPRLAPVQGDEPPTCFQREYSPGHLARNPGQKLEKLFVKVSSLEGDPIWKSAEVVGVAKGAYYGNTAGCSLARNGTLKCFIECDGGAFSLRHSRSVPGAVNFAVAKDYYFPLFKNAMSQDFESEREFISLEDDKDNGLYRLIPADPRQCDRAIRQVREEGSGGC